EVKERILSQAKEYKDYFQDENGFTYLVETDSYRWLRRIENYLNTGHFGTSKRGTYEFEDLMSYPAGFQVEPIKLYFYTGALFYKTLHFFNNRLTVMNCLAFLPVVFSGFIVLGIFWACYLFRVSSLGSFISSLIIGLNPLVLQRTSFGWFDTDVYNIIFCLLSLSCVAFSLRFKGIKYYACLIMCGLITGLYSSFWASWWLPFYFLLAGFLMYELEFVIYGSEKQVFARLKEALLSVFLLISSSFLFALLFSGIEAIKNSFQQPLEILSLRNNIALDNFWPSPVFSISELRSSDVGEVAKSFNGIIVFYGGLSGLLLTFLTRRKLSFPNPVRFLMYAFFIWVCAAIILTFSSIRFLLFLTLPIGIAMGYLWDTASSFIWKMPLNIRNKINEGMKVLFLACLFLIFTAPSISNSFRSSRAFFKTLMDDTWLEMLDTIKKDTPQDAVINTYWDYGDCIIALGQRATLVDASYQWTPVVYWITRAFLADNEKEAIGILRMLNAGGRLAFDRLLEAVGNDEFRALEIINKMLTMKRKDGLILLRQHSKDNEKIEEILSYMYDVKHPAYFLIDGRIKDIVYAISQISGWDFARWDMWRKFPGMQKEEFLGYVNKSFALSENDSNKAYTILSAIDKSDILSWVSQGRHKFYGEPYFSGFSDDKNIMIFDNGIIVDLRDLKAYFRDFGNKKIISPGDVIVIGKDGTVKNINKDGEEKYSLVLYEEDADAHRASLMSPQLANSLFMRLYHMKGEGLKYFELAAHKEKKGFNNIYLYKINWDIPEGEKRK
ncbi:MAG: STT3 domain-containing protein, partial [Candidatus Omnitrophota bacterium]